METHRRTNTRYSEAFKLHVVNELESGKLSSISEANRHYGITGTLTVKRWLKQYGRNHLIPKVIRVERPEERDEIKRLKEENKLLKKTLAETHVQNVVAREQ